MSDITAEVKQKIVKVLKERRENFGGSDRGYAGSLGIHAGQYSQIMAGNYFKVLSDAAWVSIARKLGVNLKGETEWKTAQTPVFVNVSRQLKACQEKSISAILCDDADVGKTHTAKEYVKANKYAVYIDCSQVKRKSQLVRAIAQGFGVGHTGRYADVYGDLCYYINNQARQPLVILDEAGDLEASARLELKALWNATEGSCGWYQMGADGLRELIKRGIENKKIGYVETFSRYGKKFQRFTPEGREEREKYQLAQAAMIIKANAPGGADAQKVLVKTKGSLRRIRIELSKL